jgi:hypothetical protein
MKVPTQPINTNLTLATSGKNLGTVKFQLCSSISIDSSKGKSGKY